MAFKSSEGHNHGKEVEVYGSSDIGRAVGGAEDVSTGGDIALGGIDGLYYGAFVSSPATVTSDNGNLQISTDGVNFANSQSVPRGGSYMVRPLDSAIKAASHNTLFGSDITVEYTEYSTQEVLELYQRLDKLPDSYSFSPQTNTLSGVVLEASPTVQTLTSINAPASVWVSSNSSVVEIKVSGGDWQTAPTSAGSVYVEPYQDVDVRHTTLPDGDAVTTTTLKIGFSDSVKIESDFVTTNSSSFVAAPTFLTPAAGSDVVAAEFTVTTDVATVVGGTHNATDWQVSRDSDFSTVLDESLNDTTNLRSYAASIPNLDATGNVYVRVRYRSDTGLISGWTTRTFNGLAGYYQRLEVTFAAGKGGRATATNIDGKPGGSGSFAIETNELKVLSQLSQNMTVHLGTGAVNNTRGIGYGNGGGVARTFGGAGGGSSAILLDSTVLGVCGGGGGKGGGDNFAGAGGNGGGMGLAGDNGAGHDYAAGGAGGANDQSAPGNGGNGANGANRTGGGGGAGGRGGGGGQADRGRSAPNQDPSTYGNTQGGGGGGGGGWQYSATDTTIAEDTLWEWKDPTGTNGANNADGYCTIVYKRSSDGTNYSTVRTLNFTANSGVSQTFAINNIETYTPV